MRAFRAGSLRARLIFAAAGLIALALALTGFGLRIVMDSVLNERAVTELDRIAKDLAGQAEIGPAGEIALRRTPADPRTTTAYGGLYWQIEPDRGSPLRSRSLWDAALTIPPDTSPAIDSPVRVLDLVGPENSDLIAIVRDIRILREGDFRQLVITVALDRAELSESRRGFLELLVPALVGLGLVLLLAMAIFVRQALLPFGTLRAELKALHEGRSAALPRNLPEEVQPLADDLNRLVSLQEAAVARARTQAGDLAHGLKTPLAILEALGRRAQAAGDAVTAREIEEQAALMRGQVERVLARARGASSGTLRRERTAALPIAERVLGVMRRLPDGARFDWRLDVPESLALPLPADDLTEMLGNLLDNARKWGRSRVTISGWNDRERCGLAVEDDGPGMVPAEMAAIDRGRRWDESTPGSGFGLAITRDLAEAGGGRLDLGPAPDGGLRAAVSWPRP